MYPNSNDTEFIQPPEAPVFEPDEEEWKDPLGFIAKIYPYVVKVGICKIRPPPDWQPTFSVDVEKFRFTPRIQKLHELEAKTRVKLNFIDTIAKFWELQGSSVKLPNIEKKPLDLHELHKIVQAEGGYEDVTRLRRWSRVALLMGYSGPQASAMLRRHYEKILYPYDVFMSGAMIGESNPSQNTFKERLEVNKSNDNIDYTPSYSSRYTRQSKYKNDLVDDIPDVNFETNTELKKLQFLAPGPKITGSKPAGRTKRRNKKYEDHFVDDSELSAIQGVQNPVYQSSDKNIFSVVASWGIQDYRCCICECGDEEHCMLLCDACDSSYHTFCLIPPLQSVPPGDWRCPKCVAKECNKPTEAFGFEQAKKVYSLQSFGEMADKFKEEYFSMPPHEVPLHIVEKEFWRLVHSIDDNLSVEYGADLHTKELGSGFPLPNNTDDPEDQPYIDSPWNLNNLANNDKSVLKFITQDISGMKVPWLYIGMCFSSFCWHTEDHWSYSINYCHWGEPKTWYGVPASEAEKLENCVKSIAPELFEKNPDLFHHLVTTCSPMTLMNYGVPVFRTDQHAGEFVITFPRAYHAGFNQGYNCAEAVNFCPADWLSMGFDCIEHYRKLQRAVVFSHEELVCKMASVPEALDLDIAKKLYDNMKLLVDIELSERAALHEKGIKDSEFCPYELISDDERQCDFCKCTIYFSAVVCSCDSKRLSCLKHADEICVCQNIRKYIRYRYTLNELPEMLNNLKKRADSFDNWEKQVQKVLSCSSQDRYDISAFKELIYESEQSHYPDCELLEQLKSTVVEAEQCSQVANQFIAKKHKTRKSSSVSSVQLPRLTLEELNDFVLQVKNLPCIIKEAKAIDILMLQIDTFRHEARLVLNSDKYNEQKVSELIEHGNSMDVELPEMHELKMDLKASKWLGEIVRLLNQEEPISLDVIRTCVDQGIGLKKKPVSTEPLSRLKELLFAADRWEEKAKLCLQAKPRHMIGTLEVIVQEASKVKILLPNVSALKDALVKAKEWTSEVERMQNDDYYPYYDILDALVTNGRPIPVRLEQLSQMESQVAAARAWKERTSRIFLKKGSEKNLLEVLRPRKDVGVFENKQKIEKKNDELEKCKKHEEKTKKINEKKKEKIDTKDEIEMKCDDTWNGAEGSRYSIDDYASYDPVAVAQALKLAERNEIEAIKLIRSKNRDKLSTENLEGPYCLCRKPIDGLMVPCSLCLEWYHTTCIVPPKTIYGKPIGKGFTAWSLSREVHYLCPGCCRTRRPRIDAILSLLMSLQKLPVRIAEGEALQFLTERAMNWQDRTKIALSHPEIQRISDCVKRDIEQTEKQVTHLLFLQRLLAVQKVIHIKNENQLKEENELELKERLSIKSEPIDINSLAVQSLETKAFFAEPGLECTEEMCNGSPGSKETFKSSFSNPDIVRIQSASSSRAQSPIDVCVPIVERKVLTMQPLPNFVLDELELLLYEGSVLEVGLDEVQIIWAILQIQNPLLKEDCMIMNADYRRSLTKSLKKQRKRKLEESKHTGKAINLSMIDCAAVKKLKEIVSHRKKDEKTEKIPSPIAEKEDEQDEDDCSAKPCLKPLGEEVEWVQCDACESWYHCACVKISAQEATNADEYKCPYCKTETIEQGAPGLIVIAELAHQLIKDTPVNNNDLENGTSDSNISLSSHISGLDSLFCLADASQTMDIAPLCITSSETNSVWNYSKEVAPRVELVMEAQDSVFQDNNCDFRPSL